VELTFGRHLVRIATIVAILATISGCGLLPRNDAQTPSTSRPSDGATTPSPRASAKATTARPTPSATQTRTRPWKVTLKKADSCRIARALDPKRFNASGGRISPSVSLRFPGNADCGRLSAHRDDDPHWEDPGILLSVVAVVDQGAEDYVARPEIERIIDRKFTLRGFSAYVLKPHPAQCHGLVDVAEGQLLYVWLAQPYAAEDDEIVVPQATLCKTVPRVLTATLDVLEPTRS
jgi:hypothetical protein